MFKQRFLVHAAAGLISVATTFATAQDAQSPPPSNSNSNEQQSSMGGGNSRWHHGPPDPAERTQELTKKLKLTSDQQTKVQEVLQSERSQMENLRQDGSVSQPDRRAKMMDIHQGSNTQIRALLDSSQQKKWDEMQARREQWMQNRRGGMSEGGSEPQGPPPQQ
jgi:Spy/CpxP family protein refolding chaperone